MSSRELALLLHTMPAHEVAQYHCPIAYGCMINLMARYTNDFTLEELLEHAYGAKDTSEARIARVAYCDQRVRADAHIRQRERIKTHLVNYRVVRDNALGALHNAFSWELALVTTETVVCIQRELPFAQLREKEYRESDGFHDLQRRVLLEIFCAWCSV